MKGAIMGKERQTTCTSIIFRFISAPQLCPNPVSSQMCPSALCTVFQGIALPQLVRHHTCSSRCSTLYKECHQVIEQVQVVEWCPCKTDSCLLDDFHFTSYAWLSGHPSWGFTETAMLTARLYGKTYTC